MIYRIRATLLIPFPIAKQLTLARSRYKDVQRRLAADDLPYKTQRGLLREAARLRARAKRLRIYARADKTAGTAAS